MDSHEHEHHTGEAVGGVSGALTGAAVGSPAGPIGTIIG
jgi:phage tail tape-measure protein